MNSASIRMVGVILLLSGCTIIQGVDDREPDLSCEFSIDLRGYAVHAGASLDRDMREVFEVNFVRQAVDEEGQTSRTLEASAIFDPLPFNSISLIMPDAVPPAVSLGEHPIELQIIADRQRDGRDVPSADHSWLIPRACDIAGEEYPHTTDFDDLTMTAPDTQVRTDMIVRSCGHEAAFDTVEVHVTRFDEFGDAHEVALYRRAASTMPADPDLVRAQSPIRMNQAIDDTTLSVIDILHDHNGNGSRDSEDEAWSREFDPEMIDSCPPPRDLCRDGAPTICLQDGIVSVFVFGPTDTDPDVFNSWWEEI